MKLVELDVLKFLDVVDSNSPAPGGGSVSALASSLGASLARMVAHLSFGKKNYEALSDDVKAKFVANFDELLKIKNELNDLIDRDSEAYNTVMAAYKLPKETDEEKAARSAEIQKSLKYAIQTPYDIVVLSGKAISLLGEILANGNQNAITDIGVGTMLLMVGLEGGILNVKVNLSSIKDTEYVEKITGEECSNFRNGDHTTTLMRTAGGKVVEIQHNVMNPQPYNRLYKLTGTKGYATKYPEEHYSFEHSFISAEEQQKLEREYEHPILKKYGVDAKEVGGHGGMDYIMDSRLIYCLLNGLPLDIDVYDLAEWCCLAELGSLSMDNNSASVAFPDFTRGHWNDRQGFRHAHASPEQEKEKEEIAKAFTRKLKEETIKQKLWKKFDKAQKHTK